MKNFKKFILCIVLVICILGMLATGLYALCSIGLALCAVEGNVLSIFWLLLSGIASGLTCYWLHKIVF